MAQLNVNVAIVLLALLAGWPVFLAVALITFAVSSSVRSSLSLSSRLSAAAVSFVLTVLFTLLVWRFWPVSFGGPMWMHTPVPILGPAVVAIFAVGAVVAWFLARSPNRALQGTRDEAARP
jgi:hypothetical protein